jgi:acetyl/propionyl-CoA carboxylase alpha subunit/acetyl-CoA carboxylase carboxyltransferase component
MRLRSVLVANRGEIAIRVMRAAADLGLRAVAVYAEDDARCLHVRTGDRAVALRGRGAAAYLDIEQLVAAARDHGCEGVHPGYGFLSESAAFAQRCAESGVQFVGPTPKTLALLGDKTAARQLAQRLEVPVMAGSDGPVSLEQARAFFDELGAGAAIVIKAVAGGGGRGMRVVRSLEELDAAYERCRSEARASFGVDTVYVERLMPRARHVEVQIAGDGTGRVVHLWERECSLQRRHQKLIEVAPSPGLPSALRERLLSASLRMAAELRYQSLGTFEFLVDASARDDADFVFIEANPRLQVEHTVTEAVTGVDLVQTQLLLADGRTLEQVGLSEPPPVRGFALQARVNMESMQADGSAKPEGGMISAFDLPSGPGVRVDSFGYAGYATSPSFDSLLAKVIAWSPSSDFVDAVRRAQRALGEVRIEGVKTNLRFLQALLDRAELPAGRLYTRFVDEHVAELLAAANGGEQRERFFASVPPAAPAASVPASARAGAVVDSRDPLAVLAHGKSAAPTLTATTEPDASALPSFVHEVRAPMQGTIVSVAIEVGARVRKGQELLVMEAMKMEHVIEASTSGVVRGVFAAKGEPVYEAHLLVAIEEGESEEAAETATGAVDLDAVRTDLAEVLDRHAIGLDARRPDAVERRRKTKQRTARENLADLIDEGSFAEYGPLVIAAQRRRRPVQELIEKTPADGLVAGVGRVNGGVVADDRTQCIVISYDYTVLAGTQGLQNHRKKDRMFELAQQSRLPVVLLAEGGGGRPGDSDGLGFSGLDCLAFAYFARLSGLVPLVGVASGRCFAGNALLLGCCDVVIATEGSNIGMGGPAMIEGGGLGVFRPEEIGPLDVQRKNGVVDVAVKDEREAMQVAKRYLSYFQGPVARFELADQRRLRTLIPENRMRIYDVRAVIETLADSDSVLELRRDFGLGMVTALLRVEGRPLGVIANNPVHLAGAIDRDAADKAARFMQLCDAHDLPILFLCDTPGIMVGPEAEKTAQVRHAARMLVTAQSLTVPFFTIVLRKGYGLGAQAMAGGSFKVPFFVVSWPTGEFGGMGLEGAVKLGFRKELAAMDDPVQRKDTFDKMVALAYQHGKATNTAAQFEIDDVIDPADSRHWILTALRSAPPPVPRTGKKRPFVDTW